MAASVLKFDYSTISDQKRLVRAELLLQARSHLRVRDGVHHAKWRVLILAGGAPRGEVDAIRELMPKAHITAVDNNVACLDAAIEAGVDDVVYCDLSDLTIKQTSVSYKLSRPAEPFADRLHEFDIVSLDLCGGANRDSKAIASVYRKLVATGGVLLFTFSYGRDVVEVFMDALRCHRGASWLLDAGIPDKLAGRIAYLFPPAHLAHLRCVMSYKGAEMPMCSLMFGIGRKGKGHRPIDDDADDDPISFIQVEPGDFELAVTELDPALLYACPRARIESLRRSHAAIRASYTRKNAQSDLLAPKGLED